MSKKHHDKEKKQHNGIKIPEECKKLLKLTFKKFKKENEDYFDSKKELKKSYYSQIVDYLPETISTIVKYGYLDEMKDEKNEIYSKITDPEFIKYLSKEIEKNDLEFDNITIFPLIVVDISEEAKKATSESDGNEKFDLSDLVSLSKLILKKKIKKFKKAGIDEDLAFDVLSVLPTTKILAKSQYFHIRRLFSVLYQHAANKEVDFEKIMKNLFKENEQYICSVITFALLERKEKISSFNDSQKQLFNNITEYCFKTMEEMEKDEIQSILKAYCDARKRDESQSKDTNRRYYISSLPESDYPKILKVVTKMTNDNDELKKYF